MKGKGYRNSLKIFLSLAVAAVLVVPQGFTAAKAMEAVDVSSTANKLEYVPGEVIIKYKDNGKALNSSAVIKGGRTKITANSELVKLNENVNVEDAVARLKGNKNVEMVQPNYIYKTGSVSTDTYVDELWGLSNFGQAINNGNGLKGIDINIKNAWNITKGASNVIVAVMDTGIDINHPELKDKIWVNSGEIPGNGIDDDNNGYIDDVNGWNFYDNNKNLFVDLYEDMHGTHVGGIIAADQNNTGVVGVAPNIKIMPMKFIGPDGGTTADAIRAIEYAKSKGVKIINASWGGSEYDEALKSAIENSGALFVCAAGNESNNNDVNATYPANFNLSNVISVAAVDHMGKIASFSNYGAKTVNIAAPGVDILSTIPLNGSYEWSYAYMNGTSMAAPYVSGVAALLLSNGVTNPANIKSRMMQTVKPIDDLSGKVSTVGMVDAYGALVGKAEYDRYSGADRYETCAKITQAGWNSSNVAILTVGANFADALSAAPLAKKYNAPILITDSLSMPSSIEGEIDRMKVSEVYVIGGTGAVSQNIENKLKGKNITVKRIWGMDRYETSVAVANELGGNGEAVIAYGQGFADALSIASLAAAKQIPILLVDKNIVPDSVNNYISANNITKTYVIGGQGVISDSAVNTLPSPERIWGLDRYATNAAVLNRFSSDFNLNTVYFASGKDYPDALSTSALAAATVSPIVLVDSNMSPVIKEYIDGNKSKITNKHASGGAGAIPNNIFIWLFN